jgi:hypothetical protein
MSQIFCLPGHVAFILFPAFRSNTYRKIEYREWWLNILLHAFDVPLRYRSDAYKCNCSKFSHAFLAAIASDMGKMQDIDAVMKEHASQLLSCVDCSTDAMVWRSAIRREVAAVPKFSSILYVLLTVSQAL